MPWLYGIITAWIGWKASQKAALLAAILTLGAYLGDLFDEVTALVYNQVNAVAPEIYNVMGLLGVWHAFEVILIVGNYAFWWWAWRSFFSLR